MAPNKKKNGLGKGLDALFFDNAIDESAGGSVKLGINEIEPNRAQPRKTFDEQALAELSQSIAEHGVIQPLLVRPMTDGSYQLIAGERRWRRPYRSAGRDPRNERQRGDGAFSCGKPAAGRPEPD